MVADEISWYFLRSASEVGLASNFGPLSDLAMSGIPQGSGPKNADNISDRRIAAAERQTRIRRNLLAMRQDRADVLAAAFEPRLWEPQVIGQLGHELPGVAMHLELTRRLYRDDHTRKPKAGGMLLWLSNLCLHPGDYKLAAIHHAAEQALALAFQEYERAKHGGEHATLRAA